MNVSTKALGAALTCSLVALAALGWTTPRAARQPSFTQLIAPLRVGGPIEAEGLSSGWVLGQPRRGEEQDIVFTASRVSGASLERVELHLLARGRWPGVRETRSFAVAYETPRSTASEADMARIAAALAACVSANDPGGLGPVDALRLSEAPEPPLSRVMRSMVGPRAWLAAIALIVAALCLGLLRGGFVALGVTLFVLALAVRLPHLAVPFVRDQDVQRLLSGALRWDALAMGRGLEDRHPPLHFALLHLFELFGQREAIARLPSALSGAALAPALVWAAWQARPRAHATPAIAVVALMTALSPVLVAGAREVSAIPIVSLECVLLVGLLVGEERAPSARKRLGIGVLHALLLWTSYLGVFALLGAWLVVLSSEERANVALRRAAAWGTLAGAPALGLAALTLLRDSGARAAAADHPALAWGDATLGQMFAATSAFAIDSIGLATLVLAVAALATRAAGVRLSLAMSAATWLGIALLAPVARVQPYYIASVVPLLLLAAGLPPPDAPGAERRFFGALSVAIIVTQGASIVSALPRLASLYVPDPRAMAPRYVDLAQERGLPLVAVADYDRTLLSYYAARAAGRPLTWQDVDEGVYVRSLIRTHDETDDPDEDALQALEASMAEQGALLVMTRHDLGLSQLAGRLSRCASIASGPGTQLVLCAPEASADP